MIDYIVRIEQYQNKRFEFLTKNFQMYRCISQSSCSPSVIFNTTTTTNTNNIHHLSVTNELQHLQVIASGS